MHNFTHLHVHSQYSLLDGQASIQGLVDKAIADGMKGIALTDHGNMFGIKEFWDYSSKKRKDGHDFMPILGCEMYVANRSRFDKETNIDNRGYHLIVLAKNKTGYHNLVKLVSHAWTDGFYHHPRTDREELAKYSEGLVVCSACLGGELPRFVLNEQLDQARETIQWYKQTFGEDYYIELQRHPATAARANREAYEHQKIVNPKLVELAREYGVKLICSNDIHFLNEDDAEAHDRLICLSTAKDFDDDNRMFYSKQEWMKTTEEMNALFEDIPEALDGTMEVLGKVEYYSINNKAIMPEFPIPEDFGTVELYRAKFTEQQLYDEFTRNAKGEVVLSEEEGKEKINDLGGIDRLYRIKLEADYLEYLTMQGAEQRYAMPLSDEIKERIDFELYTMKTMGYPGYFLIVQDFINVARKELGVFVGPGRGSAAGSVVSYCLDITRIDPLKYDLLFERFLNPDRISLPDIDVDFDDDGRAAVLQWVTDKYGKENVAHIITYGTMAAKMSLKDVARVEKLPLEKANILAKLIDNIPDNAKKNIDNALTLVPEMTLYYNSDDAKVRNTIFYAQKLEGNVRGTGVHACGTIICKDDITNHVPISIAEDKTTKERVIVTQYDGHVIEDTGLIKMDFLGLSTLSIIKEALLYIRERSGTEIDIDHLPLDDEATYKLFGEGNTIAIFQFESAGMRKYLSELKPTRLDDLIAMNALYRPGPMDYIPDFIKRKQGLTPITYDLPVMEKYLKDTYGVTVYQEQVMLLSRLLADFTQGESDNLRKAMGKKQRATLDKMKPEFINGGTNNGHPIAVLEKIWADWEKFASYAFNKSHAACYAWIAYQTAYLKANYPSEYMAANLSRNLRDIKEVRLLMDECQRMEIRVMGPDVNESNIKFAVNAHGDIRFGLGAIKGVGEGAALNIVEERRRNGAYKDAYDFFARINHSVCNRKILEALVLSGAFDSLGKPMRYQYMIETKNATYLDTLMRYGQACQAEKQNSLGSLFGEEEIGDIARPPIPEGAPWGQLYQLDQEKEYIGLYLSAHPLDEYEYIINNVCTMRAIDIAQYTRRNKDDEQPDNNQELRKHDPNKPMTFCGIVTDVQARVSPKNNQPYLIATIGDHSGITEIPLFGEDYVRYSNFFNISNILYITAALENKWGGDKKWFKLSSVHLIDEIKDKLVSSIQINAGLSKIDELSYLLKHQQQGDGIIYLKLQDDINTPSMKPVRLRAKKQFQITNKLCRSLDNLDVSYNLNI